MTTQRKPLSAEAERTARLDALAVFRAAVHQDPAGLVAIVKQPDWAVLDTRRVVSVTVPAETS
ncbi:hypothetical protein [Saccharopolyspora phatthalungensis]|uniref:Putative RNA-binding Zn ribbon-like protein n=1 Tax=Saccharopolyspora phatthalungensis TaxID=664693 RepID=A0A840Q8C9_9PSEU|nr:hypothetical protein [Saccharopolyspora phatthalungensis]MBB5156984.1 putative RNA-binding Zn ribbon-like protein [Saccharopolyspora phatthalungensis]